MHNIATGYKLFQINKKHNVLQTIMKNDPDIWDGNSSHIYRQKAQNMHNQLNTSQLW